MTETPELWSLYCVTRRGDNSGGFVAFFAKDQKDGDERLKRYNDGDKSAVTWASRDKYAGPFIALLCGADPGFYTCRETIDGKDRLITLRPLGASES
jgi:hypothetical protein